MADGSGAFAGIGMDALFAAPPAQLKQMLGEALWPKIYDIQPGLASKISDMLLEMESSELIDLQTARGIVYKDLCKFQSRNADKHEIKFWLMNLLVSSSRNDPWGCKTSLEAEEVQTVIDLVDNLELQEECSQKIEDAEIDGNSPEEEFASLEDLESSLEDEKRAYISQLTATLFKYNGDVRVRNIYMSHEEVNEEGSSIVQQVLVTNVMEAMNSWDRSLAN